MSNNNAAGVGLREQLYQSHARRNHAARQPSAYAQPQRTHQNSSWYPPPQRQPTCWDPPIPRQSFRFQPHTDGLRTYWEYYREQKEYKVYDQPPTCWDPPQRPYTSSQYTAYRVQQGCQAYATHDERCYGYDFTRIHTYDHSDSSSLVAHTEYSYSYDRADGDFDIVGEVANLGIGDLSSAAIGLYSDGSPEGQRVSVFEDIYQPCSPNNSEDTLLDDEEGKEHDRYSSWI